MLKNEELQGFAVFPEDPAKILFHLLRRSRRSSSRRSRRSSSRRRSRPPALIEEARITGSQRRGRQQRAEARITGSQRRARQQRAEAASCAPRDAPARPLGARSLMPASQRLRPCFASSLRPGLRRALRSVACCAAAPTLAARAAPAFGLRFVGYFPAKRLSIWAACPAVGLRCAAVDSGAGRSYSQQVTCGEGASAPAGAGITLPGVSSCCCAPSPPLRAPSGPPLPACRWAGRGLRASDLIVRFPPRAPLSPPRGRRRKGGWSENELSSLN